MLRLMSARCHVLAACAACLCAVSAAKAQSDSAKPRTDFPVDPRTPARLLLPPAPKTVAKSGPLMSDDLAKVPEVLLNEPFVSGSEGQTEITANFRLLHGKLRLFDERKGDAFVSALQAHRSDLAGLPFLRGDACRLKPGRSAIFSAVLATIHNHTDAEDFATAYLEVLKAEDTGLIASGASLEQEVAPARIAGLVQILSPKTELHTALVNCLNMAHRDATRALAKIAVFSTDDKARAAALKILDTRRESDYDDLIRQWLRYPYLPVAKRAAQALVKLKRLNWVPELIDFLEEPDPRMPSGGGNQPWKVRELVRVNHNRNCMLCHAPAHGPNDSCAAPVHIPEPCGPCATTRLAAGYKPKLGPSTIFVRFDVTYLRQDFSTMDSAFFPFAERFDYLVRTRKLSPTEAKAYEHALTPTQPGTPSPYQRAVLAALRELTGRDAAPTAAAWRELLKIEPRRR